MVGRTTRARGLRGASRLAAPPVLIPTVITLPVITITRAGSLRMATMPLSHRPPLHVGADEFSPRNPITIRHRANVLRPWIVNPPAEPLLITLIIIFILQLFRGVKVAAPCTHMIGIPTIGIRIVTHRQVAIYIGIPPTRVIAREKFRRTGTMIVCAQISSQRMLGLRTLNSDPPVIRGHLLLHRRHPIPRCRRTVPPRRYRASRRPYQPMSQRGNRLPCRREQTA